MYALPDTVAVVLPLATYPVVSNITYLPSRQPLTSIAASSTYLYLPPPEPRPSQNRRDSKASDNHIPRPCHLNSLEHKEINNICQHELHDSCRKEPPGAAIISWCCRYQTSTLVLCCGLVGWGVFFPC